MRYTNSTPSEAYNSISVYHESKKNYDEQYLIQNILENEIMTDSLKIRNLHKDKKRRPHFYISFDSLKEKAYKNDQILK